MRKLAPVFILTSVVALASGSALALGDMNKSKKSPTATPTSNTQTPLQGEGDSALNAPAATPSMTPSTSSSMYGTPRSKADPTQSITDGSTSANKSTNGASMNDASTMGATKPMTAGKPDKNNSVTGCDAVKATDPRYASVCGGGGASGSGSAGSSGSSGSGG